MIKNLSSKGLEIASRWPEPCRAMFGALREESPWDLFELCQSNTLEPCNLTFALEELGRVQDCSDLDEYHLECFLMCEAEHHPSAIVREGTFCGLNELNGCSNCSDMLWRMERLDASPGVRHVASSLLNRV